MHQLDTPGNPSKPRSKDFRVVLIYKTQARSISSPRSLMSWGSRWGFPPTKKATETGCYRNRRGWETEIWKHSCCKNPPPWWFAFGCLGCGYMEWDTCANYKKVMSWCWADCWVFPIVGHTLNCERRMTFSRVVGIYSALKVSWWGCWQDLHGWGC